MIERGTYKGKPTISLKNNETDKYAFTFGEAKARLILAHLDEIKAFVSDIEKKDK